jgi:hypothetical protein
VNTNDLLPQIEQAISDPGSVLPRRSEPPFETRITNGGKAGPGKRDIDAAFARYLPEDDSDPDDGLMVTSDRLADFLDRYGDKVDGADRDGVARVRHLLEILANE